MAVLESTGSFSASGRMHTWFRVLSLLSVFSIFSLIVLGGIVRVTESGLGCPDWPLCHGQIIPPMEMTAWIEYSHRLVASALVGPLVLATGVVAWFAYRRERWVVVPASLAIVLLLAQSILGGITVINELPGSIVMAHLALAQALLAVMLLIAVVAHRGPLMRSPPGYQKRFPFLVALAAASVYILLLSGALVTATGATMACADWPLCYGREAFPEFRLSAIHMGHRHVAAILGLFLLYVLHLGFRNRQHSPEVRYMSLGVAVLFAVQVVAGAINIWGGFPPELMALHLALATAVWGAAAALAIFTFAPPAKSATLA